MNDSEKTSACSASNIGQDEEALHEENGNRLKKSLKELHDIKFALNESAIVAVTDRNGTITYVNDAFCRISKYSREEIIGQNHRILNSVRHSATFFRELWETIGRGEVWRGEIRNRTKNGSFYWLYTTIVPFIDSEGEPYQYIAIRHDITSLKELEARLEHTKEEAEAANIRKNQFLANMSHELRTPLHTIISASNMVFENMLGPLNEKQTEYLSLIYRSGEHLLQIINDLLDIAKIDAGKLVLNIREIHLEDFIEQTLFLVEPLMQDNKKQAIIIKRGDNLPETFKGDPVRLKQVICNLLSNAHKFSPAESSIEFSCYMSDKNNLVFSVKDEGPGIPESDLERILLPFEQGLHASSDHVKGTGLGLPLCKKIVELHHGSLQIESKLGEGSRFFVDIPL